VPRHEHEAAFEHLAENLASEFGYSLRVRRVLGAGSRSALPLRFSVVFEYGGLIP
jgi:hypothetical protein